MHQKRRKTSPFAEHGTVNLLVIDLWGAFAPTVAALFLLQRKHSNRSDAGFHNIILNTQSEYTERSP
jgi:hypothetical protein